MTLYLLLKHNTIKIIKTTIHIVSRVIINFIRQEELPSFQFLLTREMFNEHCSFREHTSSDRLGGWHKFAIQPLKRLDAAM